MPRILPLPPAAVSQICSSNQITTLEGVAISLLENSLDADATKVGIAIDFLRGGCTLEDNGKGIAPQEFHSDGGLAKLYHTSKRDQFSADSVYGRHGTHLACLAALSLMQVTSQHLDSTWCATLTIHNGKVIHRHDPAPASYDLPNTHSHGTCVTVRNLFGNIPVRVKQRALVAESGIGHERQWQELKHRIVALLLSCPKQCAVRVKDVGDAEKTYTISGGCRVESLYGKVQHRNAPDLEPSGSTSKDRLQILLQAGLASRSARSRWVPLSASTPRIRLKGLICLEPAPNKRCQFVSIGIHPYLSASDHFGIYETINSVFASSSFGTFENDVDPEMGGDQPGKLKDKIHMTKGRLLGRKGVDRWPAFILQLSCESAAQLQDGETTENHNLAKSIVDIVKAAALQWLSTNHFRQPDRNTTHSRALRLPVASLDSEDRQQEGYASFITRSSASTWLKRAATTDGLVNTKRMRAEKDHLHDDTALHQPGLSSGTFRDINSWSRVKSGNHTSHRSSRHKEISATTPEAHWTAKIASSSQRRQSIVFRMPPTEPGALSSGLAQNAQPLPSSAPRDISGENANISSDDYGSVDEQALCDAAEAATSKRASNLTVANDLGSHSCAIGGDTVEKDEAIQWIDQATNHAYNVNARTGMISPICEGGQAAEENADVRRTVPTGYSQSSEGRPLTLSRRLKSGASHEKASVMPGFLKDWQNPVFVPQREDRIPRAAMAGLEMGSSAEAENYAKTKALLEFPVSNQASKLSKSMLARVRVIRQVDRKFILCKADVTEDDDRNGYIVFLVDQHAASERVILEHLLDELCAPINEEEQTRIRAGRDNDSALSEVNSVLLEQPIRFGIPGTEQAMFERSAQHFARWGILYHITNPVAEESTPGVSEPRDECVLVVNALPPGIAERCRMSPALLLDLLRTEVWINNGAVPRHQKCELSVDGEGQNETPRRWLSRIASCPQGIVDMLNSRACRSAIMFNDSLSNVECEQLVGQLVECAFPFACAHGRVSMVPVIHLASGSAEELCGAAATAADVRGCAFRRF